MSSNIYNTLYKYTIYINNNETQSCLCCSMSHQNTIFYQLFWTFVVQYSYRLGNICISTHFISFSVLKNTAKIQFCESKNHLSQKKVKLTCQKYVDQ